MVKGVILGMRHASNDRACVAVVFTGRGDKAFCTGGNTKEYAEYYAGRPEEYRQYMRLFNDMVTAILHCDKPVICRVNGMRIAGGQEIGMACDFSVARTWRSSARPVPTRLGARRRQHRLPAALRRHRAGDGELHALRALDGAQGAAAGADHQDRARAEGRRQVRAQPDGDHRPLARRHGPHRPRRAEAGRGARRGKAILKRGEVDLALLDEAVDGLITSLAMTMPGCLTKTIESVRKHKLAHWDKNRETNRAWLGLNMMTEGRAGFRAFHEGTQACREADFLLLRRRLAEGAVWGEELTNEILAKAHGKA